MLLYVGEFSLAIAFKAHVQASALVGVVSAAVSNLSTRLKNSMRVDDPMDIFSVHALAGMVGCFMTGLFAQSSVAANDGFSEIDGGWLDQNWKQMYKQIAVSWFQSIAVHPG